jgi:hypothetical protein
MPGAVHDYCDARLTTTVIDAAGAHTIRNPVVPATSPIDCFYVYPTVSLESRGNSDLVIQTSEQDVAVSEASPFEQDCRVFAPMYHQVTSRAGECFQGLCLPNGSYQLEYRDVLAAWRDYIAHYNDGRGVVLLGHSEGSFLLKDLIQKVIDRTPSEQRLLVSAILVGGDVVAADQGRGGDIPDTPPCASREQTGCIVAYSTFDKTPPKDASFESVNKSATEHVLCVNPTDPGSSSAEPVTPWFPAFDSGGVAPLNYGYKWFWVQFPQLYTARCVRAGSRAWLLIQRIHTSGDKRPTARAVDGPNWGLHEADLTIALPQLVSLVRDESAAYRAQHK